MLTNKLTKTFTVGKVALGVLIGLGIVSAPAHAALVPGLWGASDFGLPDGTPGSLTCPLCDSTVNFAVYENTDGDWTDDPFFAGFDLTEFDDVDPSAFRPVDSGAAYVFLYQVINTDPLGVSNPALENFNVTKTLENGDPSDDQPYFSVGYVNSAVFQNARLNVGLDVPNNWEPSQIFNPGPLVSDANAINPSSGRLSVGPEIVSASVRAGQDVYTGALWEFGGLTDLPANRTSTVLFLTSEDRWETGLTGTRELGIVWAETESPGDVVGIKNVPEPGTILGLLAVGGAGLLSKLKKQK